MNNTSIALTEISTRVCSKLPVAHGAALITTNTAVSLFGTLGNLLVCMAFATNPNLRRSSNYLLVTLAIADLMATMVCEPLFLAILVRRTFSHSCARNLEIAYFYVCNFSASVSVVNMAVISIDRLIAIAFPFRHKNRKVVLMIRGMLAASWILIIALNLSAKFLIARQAIRGFIVVGIFTISYVIIFVSYMLIVMCLVRQKRRRRHLGAPSANLSSYRYEARVAFTCAIVIFVFTPCWFPLFIVFTVTGKTLVKPFGYVHYWIRTVALSNSAMNFVIYGSRMPNFRDSYIAIFRRIAKSLRTSPCRSDGVD